MQSIYIDAIGLATPGMPNWQAAVPILCGEEKLVAAPLEKYKPTQLPPNEARRATELVRMAFRVCEEVMSHSTISMQECASVFSSSGGDYPIIDQICRSLCDAERLVSPTQFHNSVHNSAAGYWSIATGSQKPATAVGAFDASFVAGLLEAFTICVSEQLPTLFVVYDIKPPYPLSEKRNIPVEFGAAFLLNSQSSPSSVAQISLSVLPQPTLLQPTLLQTTSLQPTNTPSRSQDESIETLRLANPAARCLPLLELLAQQRAGVLVFEKLEQYLFQIDPCAGKFYP